MALRTADGEWRTAHEFVRETLRQAILRGDLTGGSRLIQADLATQLRVSTTPVREALRDLATEGLITLDRHRGGVVRELNWDDMEEIRQIRQQLEPLAISMAVAGITDDQLAEAERLCDRMEDVDDLASWVDLNLQVPLPLPRGDRREAARGRSSRASRRRHRSTWRRRSARTPRSAGGRRRPTER